MKTLFTFLILYSISVSGQDINRLLADTKAKIDRVNDYEATGKMKTNVAFLKVPIANITLWFKKPGKIKLKSEKGVSFIPRGAMSINTNNLLNTTDFTVMDAGTANVNGIAVRVARILPNDDNADLIISTLYIDPTNAVIIKARTTTKENGTYELEMNYKNYIAYGLPDKIIFSFNTKDYKLPKGVTFDFDDGSQTQSSNLKNKKGRAEITFKRYIINAGVSDDVFNKK